MYIKKHFSKYKEYGSFFRKHNIKKLSKFAFSVLKTIIAQLILQQATIFSISICTMKFNKKKKVKN